jgi:hypothetical protein
MINSNLNLEKHWGGEHSFQNSPLKRPHSHSLAPCAPAFLADETGCWKRVSKNEGQQYLYSPPLGHPWDPPLDHPPRPTLHRAPIVSSIGPLPLSIGHPCTFHWALVRLWRAPVHPPLSTRSSVHLPYSPSGYRGPPWSLHRATPSDIKFFSSTSLLIAIFIHFLESSSIAQKMHPLSRKLIHYWEISSSVQKVHLLRSKCILCLPNSSTMPFLE